MTIVQKPLFTMSTTRSERTVNRMRYHCWAVPDSESFRLEKDLVAVLRDTSASAFGAAAAECDIVAEMQVGMRVPDLLLVFNRSSRDLAPVKLSYFECALLASALTRGTASISELAQTTYAPREQVKPRVARLAQLGFVKLRGEQLTATKGIGRHIRIVAIEAKLSRWKDALLQAQKYRSFANEAYIAMPTTVVRKNLTAVEACADSGVGIIAVDQTGADVFLNAERAQPQSAEWVRILSSAVGLPQTRPATSSNAARQAR